MTTTRRILSLLHLLAITLPQSDLVKASAFPVDTEFTDIDIPAYLYMYPQFCPYTSLCTIDGAPDINDFEESLKCCHHCSCRPHCKEMGNCCPDFKYVQVQGESCCQAIEHTDSFNGTCCPDHKRVELSHQESNDSSVTFECIRPQAKVASVFSLNQDRVRMISSCRRDYENQEVISRCLSTQSSELSLLRPVTSNVSDFVYRNVYCALCNGHNETSLLMWDIAVQCPSFDDFEQMQSQTEFSLTSAGVQSMIDSSVETCLVVFRPPYGTGSESAVECYPEPDVFSCNVTGLWDVYRPDLEQACGEFILPYGVEGLTIIYANIYCYLCNYKMADIISQPFCLEPLFLIDFTKIVPFTALLNFQRNGKEVPTKESQSQAAKKALSVVTFDGGAHSCTANQFFDRNGLCRELLCPRDQTWTDGECRSIMLGVIGSSFQLKFKVDGSDAHSKLKILLSFQEFSDNLRHLLNGTFIEQGYELCGLNIWDKNFDKGQLLIDPLIAMVCLYSKDLVVYNDILETVKPYVDNDLKLNLSVDGEEIGVVLSVDSSSDVQKVADDMVALDIETNRTLKTLYRYKSSTFDQDLFLGRMLFTELHFCPNIKLLPEEYIVDGRRLYLSEQGLYLNPDQFFTTIRENQTVQIVCAFHLDKGVKFEADVMKTPITATILFSRRDLSLYILTIVLTSISMAALVSLLVLFHVRGRYNNKPGKITGILALHLLLSQGLYQFGIDQTVVPPLCSLLGVLLHFFWLSTFFWMGSCTFHMVSVFCFNNRFEYLYPPIVVIYSLFCYIASLAFLSITIGHAMVMTGGQEIGYGGQVCYISFPVMIGYAFALPVGIVILFNILACSAVVIGIRKDQFNQPHGQGKSFALVYLKISVFSGVQWVFGYIYVLTGFVWTEYVFVIFSASQGLFLLLAQSTTKTLFRSCAGLLPRKVIVGKIEMVNFGTKSTRD